METVTLKPLFHNSAECIAIYSIQSATLNHYFQKKAGAKWSSPRWIKKKLMNNVLLCLCAAK